jgi:tellurite resistance-related uncharacterized protein/hemoglobin-like flavoprotein
MVERLPLGLVPSGGSLIFTEETIPDALKATHQLAPGRWGVLHIFEGSLGYANLGTDEDRIVSAPDLIVIHPELPHRVWVDGAVNCRIDFFRETETASAARTPGAFADEDVFRSFDRCEATGGFAEIFYNLFLDSSPEVAPYFAATDFEQQRHVLRDSVYMMVTREVTDPAMRQMLDQLGAAHNRDEYNVLPRLYELWLDSICETGRMLDPEWDDEIERKWRVRLRPGLQIIMAAY